MSASCFHNDVWHGHSDVLAPIAFLAIPKGMPDLLNPGLHILNQTLGTAADDIDKFRIFKKQLYHNSIARVLKLLKPHMTTPRVTLSPDSH